MVGRKVNAVTSTQTLRPLPSTLQGGSMPLVVMQGCTQSESELLISGFLSGKWGASLGVVVSCGSGQGLGGLEGRGSALLGFLLRPPLCIPSFLPWPLAPRFPSSRAKGATAWLCVSISAPSASWPRGLLAAAECSGIRKASWSWGGTWGPQISSSSAAPQASQGPGHPGVSEKACP